jgi:hypothetical protein
MFPSVLAPRRRLTCRQHIAATPTEVFPLLCPARETEWLPGWSFRMIHSHSGVAELGAVFETESEAGRTIWLVTEHAPPFRICFVRFQADGLLAEIAIDIDSAKHGSHVDIAYTFTALGSRGEAALGEWGDPQWAAMMERWESAMNRWFDRRSAG